MSPPALAPTSLLSVPAPANFDSDPPVLDAVIPLPEVASRLPVAWLSASCLLTTRVSAPALLPQFPLLGAIWAVPTAFSDFCSRLPLLLFAFSMATGVGVGAAGGDGSDVRTGAILASLVTVGSSRSITFLSAVGLDPLLISQALTSLTPTLLDLVSLDLVSLAAMSFIFSVSMGALLSASFWSTGGSSFWSAGDSSFFDAFFLMSFLPEDSASVLRSG
mmetsp:Transcript_7882/g.12254  ORF Transcript_7882/g.12254 Transcript_7882/m.12254 type:complete len:219 (+) Transcript_7882:3655-4311(+)